MTDPSSRPIRVLELRSTAGQGGGPERAMLLAATAAHRYPRVGCGGELIETLCFLRRRGEDELQVHRRALELGVGESRDRGASRARAAHAGAAAPAGARALDPARARSRLQGRLLRVRTFAARARDPGRHRARLAGAHAARALRLLPGAIARCCDRFRWCSRSPRTCASGCSGRARAICSTESKPCPTRSMSKPSGPTPARARECAREWGVREGEHVVGILGRLDPEKRPDLLVEAFAAVAARRPEAAAGGGG